MSNESVFPNKVQIKDSLVLGDNLSPANSPRLAYSEDLTIVGSVGTSTNTNIDTIVRSVGGGSISGTVMWLCHAEKTGPSDASPTSHGHLVKSSLVNGDYTVELISDNGESLNDLTYSVTSDSSNFYLNVANSSASRSYDICVRRMSVFFTANRPPS
jgi:hypothetical protein